MADYGASDTSTTTLGANQFPISDVWVPNDALRAVGGGPTSTDAGGKVYAPVHLNLKYIADTAVTALTPADAVANPTNLQGVEAFLMGHNGTTWDRVRTYNNTLVTTSRIRHLISQGKAFRATTTMITTNAANAFVGFLMRANTLSVNIVVYRIAAIGNVNMSDGRIYYNTTGANTDVGLSVNLLTANTSNQQVGGAATAVTSLSGSPASTTQTTGMGGTGAVQVGIFGAGVQPLNEILSMESQIWLPSGADRNFSVYGKMATSANILGYMIEWVEI